MKFNRSQPSGIKARQTTNLAGGTAYSHDTKTALSHLLLTSLMNGNKFYESEADGVVRLRGLIDALPDNEKIFAAKAAIFARDRFNMRSASHVAAAHIGHTVKGEEWTKRFFHKVCVRPDDPMEILSAYWIESGKQTEPNSMKKGFARFLEGLDEYKLAKYRKDGAVLNMMDLVNLIHPRPTKALNALMKGTLPAAETWETKLTQAGQVAETEEEKEVLKAEAWMDLLKSRKLGYMACLRNLRNIAETCNDETLAMALELLVNEKAVLSSRVLPFRFLTAYKLFKYDTAMKIDSPKRRAIASALNKALDISFQNVPDIPGRTMVAIDFSGSMNQKVTCNPNGSYGKGRYIFSVGWNSTDISLAELAMLLGVGLAKRNNADILFFADKWAWYDVDLDASIMSNVERAAAMFNHGGTNWNLPFEIPLNEGKQYDRIITFSDEQGWIEGKRYGYTSQDTWKRYKAQYPGVHAYLVDMAGYGTSQLAGNDVAHLAGFSEKLFDLISRLETDPKALVNEIEAIVI